MLGKEKDWQYRMDEIGFFQEEDGKLSAFIPAATAKCQVASNLKGEPFQDKKFCRCRLDSPANMVGRQVSFN